MPLYTYEAVDGSCVIHSPSRYFVGYAPTRIIADNLVRHLNDAKRANDYTLVSVGVGFELRKGSELIASTRRASLSLKERPLSKDELENYLALLNGRTVEPMRE